MVYTIIKIVCYFIQVFQMSDKPKLLFTEGLKVNKLLAIKQVDVPEHLKKKSEIYALFRCDCGVEKVINYRNVVKEKQKSCGCSQHNVPKTHGMVIRNKKMYECYNAMMSRCYDQNHPEYENYGGRGITVCDSWHSIENFFNDMESTHSKDLTLDREDVNGNYCAENCSWKTKSWQGFNKQKSKFNTSGKTGVYWNKEKQKWETRITVNLKKIFLGYYASFEDAVEVREQAELEYFGRLKGN